MGLIDWIFGMKRFLVHENERVITLYKGKVKRILGPGEYALPNRRNRLTIARYDIVTEPFFASNLTRAIMSKIPDQAKTHLTTIQTSTTEVAMIERDGQLYSALGPDEKVYVWNDSGPWSVSKIDVSKDFSVSPTLMKRSGISRIVNYFYVKEVLDGQVALVYIDGAYDRKLGPGLHGFWRIGKSVVFKIIDTRRQSLDVGSQEVLTKDRVTIRVNIAADYKVVDPLLATTKVKDFEDALYRSLQYAFRKTLGSLSLDQILEKKVSIDADASQRIKTEMAEMPKTIA